MKVINEQHVKSDGFYLTNLESLSIMALIRNKTTIKTFYIRASNIIMCDDYWYIMISLDSIKILIPDNTEIILCISTDGYNKIYDKLELLLIN